MTGDEIKAIRTELRCTARELAAALGLEQEVVLSWERGDLFPTRRHVDAMTKLRAAGPAAIPRRPKKSAAPSAMRALADPEVWQIVRKIIAHPELRAAVGELAARFSDPSD